MLPRKTCAWAAPSRRREIKQSLCMDITPRLKFRATRRVYDEVTADKTVGKRLRRADGHVQSNSQMAVISRDYGSADENRRYMRPVQSSSVTTDHPRRRHRRLRARSTAERERLERQTFVPLPIESGHPLVASVNRKE